MESLALARDFEDHYQPYTDQTDQTAPEFNDQQTAVLRAAHFERLALRLLNGEPVSTYPLSEIAEALLTAGMTAAPVTTRGRRPRETLRHRWRGSRHRGIPNVATGSSE
jgi:hypothetical protein